MSALTDKGTALVPLIEDMRSYGRRWLPREAQAPPPPFSGQRALCKPACTRRTPARAAEARPVTTLESTTERLQDALRRLAVEAADLFDDLLANGAGLPFDLEASFDEGRCRCTPGRR